MSNRFDDTNGTLGRLNDALSSLESRMGLNNGRAMPQNDVAAIRARQQALQTPQRHAQRPVHYGSHQQAAPTGAHADELRAELAQLRADMQREMSGDFSAGVNTLRNDIKTMQQAQAHVTSGSASSAAQELRADIAALKSDVAQLARQDSINDLMERWAVVEREIGNLPNTLGSRDDMLAMADRLELVQQAVSQLPQDQRMSGLEDQLRILAMAVEQIADAGSNNTMPLDGLNARFDEISRAIAAIPAPEAPLPAAGLDAVERIEARISALSRMLENDDSQQTMAHFDNQFAEMSNRLNMIQEETSSLRTHAATAFPTELFDRLEERIGNVAEKLDHVNQPAAGIGLDNQFADIANRLTALHDETSSLKTITTSGLPTETLEALGGRIEQLAAAIGENTTPASNNTDEQRFAEFNERLHHIAEQLNNNSNAAEETAKTLINSLDQRMDEIARRIDENESQSSAVPSMGTLEKRLEDITQMLATSAAAPASLAEMPDIRGLEEQVAQLTQSISGQEAPMSQAGLLNAARIAAEEAVERMSAQSPGPINEDLTRLAEDLNVLETLARDSDDRNSRTFEAIHDTLLKVVDHLSSLEDTVKSAPTSAVMPSHEATLHATNEAMTDAPMFGAADLGGDNKPEVEERFESARVEIADTPSLAPQEEITPEIGNVDAPSLNTDYEFEPTGSPEPRGNLSPAEAAMAAADAAVGDPVRAARARKKNIALDVDSANESKSLLKDMAGKLRGKASANPEEELSEAEKLVGEPDVGFEMPASNILDEGEPIAPGTGGADLGEIMRRVREERAGGGPASSVAVDGEAPQSRDDSGKSDFIAAARRAAKAAAADATVVKREDAKSQKGKSQLISKLSSNKKPLLMGALAILVAVAAVPLAGKFLSSSSNEVAGQSAVESSNPIVEQNAVAENALSIEEEPLGLDEESVVLDDAALGENIDTAENVVDPLAEPPIISETAEIAAPVIDQGSNVATLSINDIPENVGSIAMREAAASGDGQALYLVGDYYTGGVPGQSENDLATAFKWYLKSAETGYAPAQYRIGNFYEKGFGTTRDFAEAKTWYQMAADQGNAAAMHNLAVLFASGADGEPDMVQATNWFKKAADLGVKDSQFNLGILSAQGQGVEQDLVESYKWFAVAAKTGDKDATAKRDEVAEALRPDQLEQAKGAAELWKVVEMDEDKNFVIIPDEWRTDQTQTASKPAPQIDADQMKQAVRNIQAILNQNGFDAGVVDGIMGGKTKTAIMQFQKANGMAANGEVTQELVRKLIELNANKTAKSS